MEWCDCGFSDASVAAAEIEYRVKSGLAAVEALLLADTERSARRPSDDRWSNVEYAAHVRDVLLTVRDRLVIGLVEDNPGFKPLYREERVELGLYRTDSVEALVPELQAAAAMFLRLFGRIDPQSLDRPVQYGYPRPSTRTLAWMGKQVVHEIEHHLRDIEDNAGTLAD